MGPQRNPWIDPRVDGVTPAQLLAWLDAHGWTRAACSVADHRLYESTAVNGRSQTIVVPMSENIDNYRETVITFVSAIANREGRYAVEVLDEILS